MAPGDGKVVRLSAEVKVTLRSSSAGYGLKVKPVVIRSDPTSGPMMSGTYTILEVADVDSTGVAAAAGVHPGDILLRVCGVSVQSGGSQALMAAMAMASVREVSEWCFLRLNDARTTVSDGGALDRRHIAAVVRAYQERAATLLQAQWRGLRDRKQMFKQLEREAGLMEQRLFQTAVAAASLATRERVSNPDKSDVHSSVQHGSAVRIQSRWRGVQARRDYWIQREREHHSAVRIQSRWRGMRARRDYWIQLEDEAERLEREMTTVEAELASGANPTAVPLHDEGRPCAELSSKTSPPVDQTGPPVPDRAQPVPSPPDNERKDIVHGIQCTFDHSGSLGIGFGCQGVNGPVYITKIRGGSPAAQQPQLSPGLVLAAVQGTLVNQLDFHSTLQLVKHASRPVTLVFTNPPNKNEPVDRSLDQKSGPQSNAESLVVAPNNWDTGAERLGQQLRGFVDNPKSDPARALEVLKQARQRLADAHRYQMKMALKAATEAAERQVHEATEAANSRHQHLAAKSRQAHVKHVQARVSEAQQMIAQQHMAAAVIQSKHRQRAHRQSLSRILQRVGERRDLMQRELQSSAEALRHASAAESEGKLHASQVQALSIANADLQKDLCEMTAQLDEAKQQQVLAETLYRDQVSKTEDASRRVAELEVMLTRTQEDCNVKLKDIQRAHEEECASQSRATENLLDAKDRERETAWAALEQRHVSAAKIQASVRAYRYRNVVKELLRAYTGQRRVYRDTAQALLSTVATDGRRASLSASVLPTVQSLSGVYDIPATDATTQTQMCNHHHAAATIQRRYHEFCYTRAMKHIVAAAAAHADHQRSLSCAGGVNQVTGTLYKFQQDARRATRELRDEIIDVRNAFLSEKQKFNQQLQVYAIQFARIIKGVHEDHAGLVALLNEERRKVQALQAMQLASADEMVQVQNLHTSKLADCSKDLQECRAALEASRLAERQATEQIAHERHALALLSDTNVESQEVWVAKVRSAHVLLHDAERRVKAVQDQVLAQRAQAVDYAVATALREAGDAATTELDAKMRATVVRYDEEKLTASHKLSVALERAESAEKELAVIKQDLEESVCYDEEKLAASHKLSAALERAESAETELAVIKQDLDQAEQKLSELDNDTKKQARGDAKTLGKTQVSAEHKISNSVWFNEATPDGHAWEEVMRENTETKVSQMRAEAEVAHLRRQLQFTTQLQEELEVESAQKDEQIATLKRKVNALRRHRRSLQGEQSSNVIAPAQNDLWVAPDRMAYDGDGLSTYSGTSVGRSQPPPPRQQAWVQNTAALIAGQTPLEVLDRDSVGKAARGWQSEEEQMTMRASSSRMTELENSVGNLVQRLQCLGNLSGRGRQTDQQALDELRRRLRGSADVRQATSSTGTAASSVEISRRL